MDPTRASVLVWIEGRTGHVLSPADQADILRATGRNGDAAQDLLTGFARAHGVDMRTCRIDLYAREASTRGPTWPIRHEALRLPVSVTLLVAAAQAGCWPETQIAPQTGRDWRWVNGLVLLLGPPVLTAALIALLF